jgi:hypothetical protein
MLVTELFCTKNATPHHINSIRENIPPITNAHTIVMINRSNKIDFSPKTNIQPSFYHTFHNICAHVCVVVSKTFPSIYSNWMKKGLSANPFFSRMFPGISFNICVLTRSVFKFSLPHRKNRQFDFWVFAAQFVLRAVRSNA